MHALADQLNTGPRRAHRHVHHHRAAIGKGHLRPRGFALLQLLRCPGVLSDHRQFAAAHRRIDLPRREGNIVHGQRRYIFECASLQHALGVASVQRKAVHMSCLGIGAQWDRLRRHRTVLLHLQLQRSRVRLPERQLHFDLIGTGCLPIGFQLFAR